MIPFPRSMCPGDFFAPEAPFVLETEGYLIYINNGFMGIIFRYERR